MFAIPVREILCQEVVKVWFVICESLNPTLITSPPTAPLAYMLAVKVFVVSIIIPPVELFQRSPQDKDPSQPLLPLATFVELFLPSGETTSIVLYVIFDLLPQKPAQTP